MKEIIEKAKLLALKESKKSVRPLSSLATAIAEELAEKLNANKDIVILGSVLMDLKRKQAMEEGRIKDHVKMSHDAAAEFLNQFNIPKEDKQKILNCVEAHHGDVPFACIEAEICANADCYKFLHPKGVLLYFTILGKRFDDFPKVLEGVEEKLEEKHNALTLDISKKELEPYYKAFKELFEKAKSEK